MRTSMPSDKSAFFLLANVAMEETKQHMPGKFITGNFGNTRKKNA